MIRETPRTRVFKGVFSALLSMCLTLGLVPLSAFGNGTFPSGPEAQQRISEDVRVTPDKVSAESAYELENSASGEVDRAPVVSEDVPLKGVEAPASAGAEAGPSQEGMPLVPKQTVAEVPVAGTAGATATLLVDGLEYEVDETTHSATLMGWYGDTPQGDLSIPSQVTDNAATYDVVALGHTAATPGNGISAVTEKTGGGRF